MPMRKSRREASTQTCSNFIDVAMLTEGFSVESRPEGKGRCQTTSKTRKESETTEYLSSIDCNANRREDEEKTLQALQEKCTALQELLDILDRQTTGSSGSGDQAEPLALWREKCFKAVLRRNCAEDRARVAEGDTASSRKNLQHREADCQRRESSAREATRCAEEACRRREKIARAIAKEMEIRAQRAEKNANMMRSERGAALEAKERSKAITNEIVKWSLHFTEGYNTHKGAMSFNGTDTTEEAKYQLYGGEHILFHITFSSFLWSYIITVQCVKNSASITQAFKVQYGRKCNLAQAKERALLAAISLLDSYNVRLFKVASSLRLLDAALAMRDCRMRNSEAALAAERAAWNELMRREHFLGKQNQSLKPEEIPPNNHKNMLGREERHTQDNAKDGTYKRGECIFTRRKKEGDRSERKGRRKRWGLSAEGEILIREIFKKVARGANAEKADVVQFIRKLENEARLSLLMNRWYGDESTWNLMLLKLEKRFKKKESKKEVTKCNTITWGEFLLCFFATSIT